MLRGMGRCLPDPDMQLAAPPAPQATRAGASGGAVAQPSVACIRWFDDRGCGLAASVAVFMAAGLLVVAQGSGYATPSPGDVRTLREASLVPASSSCRNDSSGSGAPARVDLLDPWRVGARALDRWG